MASGGDHEQAPTARERTRAALINATISLIEEEGFAGIRVVEIAQRAGMSTGAIYSSFEDRDDLVRSALVSNINEYVDEVVQSLKRSTAQPTPEGIRAQLEAELDAIFTSQRQIRRTRRIAGLLSAQNNPTVMQRIVDAYDNLSAEVERAIRFGAAAGGLAPEPTVPIPVIARLMTILPHGLEIVLGTGVNWDESPIAYEVHCLLRRLIGSEAPAPRGRNALPPSLPIPPGEASKHPSATRAKVLKATRECIAEHGFLKVRITDVAERANLSTGAIYSNFTGRHEMICQALLEDYYDGIRQETAALLTQLGSAEASGPALTAIRGMFSTAAVPRLVRRMEAFIASASEPGVTRALRQTQASLVAELAVAFAKGETAGLFRNPFGLSPVAIAYVTASLPLGLLQAVGLNAEWETNETVQGCADFLRVMVGLADS